MAHKVLSLLSTGAAAHPRARVRLHACLLASVASFALTLPAYANPEGGQVTAGQASITAGGNRVDVHQGSNRAIIDWRSFDIAPNEITQFHQPSASSVTLNRVNAPNPSTIAGQLKANGSIVLINPNGVFFTGTSQVDVNGIVATTADIGNAEFMAGSTHFNRAGNPAASVINEGTINAREAGLVGLVAPNVENSGVINARLGRVALASGDTATVDLYGDGLVSVAVSDEVKNQLVRNTGRISADGGTVQITAAAGRQVVDSLIEVKGEISAPTVATRRGRIIIQGETTRSAAPATVLVSGQVAAKGTEAGEEGGQIDILGDNIGILTGAVVDASGDAAGGSVRIGGDYQGTGDTQRAQNTIVQEDTLIDVSATGNGNGGRAIMWADEHALFAGRIRARGGNAGGNGGFVETSGKNILSATGTVDAYSPYGAAGQWLLDPNNITIQTTGSNTNVTGSPNFTTTNNSAIVTVASIQATLNAGTSVTITTGAAGSNSQTGDITVANSIVKSAGANASLTLMAHRSITLNTGVSISSTSGQMDVVLNADRDANSTGSIVLTSGNSILSNGGNITFGGGLNPLTTAAVGYSGSVTGISLTGSTLNAAGGNISLYGRGFNGTTNNYGVLLQTGTRLLTTGAGTITLNGTGGGGTTGNRGVYLTSANTEIRSENGAITLSGQGGGSSTTNEGIVIGGGAFVSATGTGTINLTGHAAAGTVQGILLSQTAAFNTLRSAGGDVSLRSNQTIQLANAHIMSSTLQAFNIVLNADIDANASGRIALTTSNLMSYGGNITLGGGTNPLTGNAVGVAGAVEGINLNASTLDAAGGNISLRGTGRTVAAVSNFGVFMQAGAKAQTVGTGTVTINGTGGVGTNTNYGVYFTGTNTAVSTVNGALTINGTGRGTGTGNSGFVMGSAATVLSSGAGAVTITGSSSGTGTTGNRGIHLLSTNTVVGAGSGSLTLTGTAGGTTTTNEGVYIETAARINVMGAAPLTLTGHAAGTTLQGIYFNQASLTDTIRTNGGNVSLISNTTIHLTNANIMSLAAATYNLTFNADRDGNNTGRIITSGGSILTYGGNITMGGGSDPLLGNAVGVSGAIEGINISGTNINAAGGNISLRGRGFAGTTNSFGVIVQANGRLQTTGAGSIYANGTGGVGTTGNRGFTLTGASSFISAQNGDITLVGQGSGSTTTNEGFYISGNAYISSTGTGAINLTGHAGGTTVQGVYLNQSAATNTLRSAGGAVTLTSNQTVHLSNAHIMSPTAQSFNVVLNADRDANASGRIALSASNIISSGGSITLGGGTNPLTGYAVGVAGGVEGIYMSNANVSAGGGNVTLNGRGRTVAGANNFGVYMLAAAKAQTGGAGNVTINGIGGTGTATNYGVHLTGTSTLASVANGLLSISGTGNGNAATNYGIWVAAGAVTSATGTGGITLTGQGSTAGTTGNRGIYYSGTNTQLAAVSGGVNVTGTGGGSTTGNEGFYLDTGAIINLTSTAPLTLTGQAGGTTVQGIFLTQAAATNTIRSAGGNVTLRSNKTIQLSNAHIMAPGAQAFNVVLNSDVDANNSGRIALTNSNILTNGGNITLGGGANPLTGNSVGVSGAVEGINLNNSDLNAAGGNISLRGTGFAGTTNNYGVLLQAAAKAQTNGNGTVTIVGQGGAGTSGNRGVYLTGANTRATTQNGALLVTGTGAGTGTGYGIDLSISSALSSTGSGAITLNARGGAGADGYFSSGAAPNIGGVSHTGNTVINTNSATWAASIIRTTGNVTFSPLDAATTVGVAGGAGTLGVTAAVLGTTTAGSITIGRTDGAGLMTVNARTWSAPVSLLNGTANIAINGAQVMGARSFRAQTTSAADIVIGAGASITSTATGTAITLAAGRNFINSGGASALTAASGRWLVFSTNPATNTLGGITSDFRRFSCTISGSCPSFAASGNGLLYSYTPLLTITPNALANINYGDVAPTLTAYNYTASGYLGADSAADSLSGTLNGATNYTQGSNVGTYSLDHADCELTSTLGYGFTYADNASALVVDPRLITATLQDKTITYGTLTPTLDKDNAADVVWGNLYASDTASITAASFTYGGASPATGNNAGTYTLGLSGITSSNYVLGTVTDSNLTINPYTLAVSADAADKNYGATDPALTYTYGALQNGDTASVFTGALTRAVGENVGGYAITQGTLDAGSNYTISFTDGLFSISPYILAVTANAAGKAFRAVDPALTYTYGALQNGDDASVFSGALSRAVGEASGTYQINIGTLTAGSNYIINYTSDLFTIAKGASLPGTVSQGVQPPFNTLGRTSESSVLAALEPMAIELGQGLAIGQVEASIMPGAGDAEGDANGENDEGCSTNEASQSESDC